MKRPIPLSCFRKEHISNLQYKKKTIIQANTEPDILIRFDFVVDNFFETIGGHVFQQKIGILIETNCASMIADGLHRFSADYIPFAYTNTLYIMETCYKTKSKYRVVI